MSTPRKPNPKAHKLRPSLDEPDQPAVPKSNLIFSYVAHHWPMLLVLVGAVLLFNYQPAADWLGGALTKPILVVICFALAFFARHVTNRKSTEPYVNSGQYALDFNALPPLQKVWITVVQIIGYGIIVALAMQAHADDSLGDKFAACSLRPSYMADADDALRTIVRNRARYEKVAAETGVPWYVIASLHNREASLDFHCHLAEGSSLQHRTRYVPKGLLKTSPPPYSWEQGATAALAYDHMGSKNWNDASAALFAIEGYNGLGYYHMGIPSPYVWAGTSVYRSGKYVADGKFSRSAVDQQLGVATLVKRMLQKGVISDTF
jgi:lysozyme family protein